MRQMAGEGRTVLVSSHLMAEMSVIGEGRLLVVSEMDAFERDHEYEEIRVRTPGPQPLRGRVVDAGGTVRDLDATSFAVSGLDSSTIGALALQASVELHELAPVRHSLEDAFMELTAPGTQRAPVPAGAVPADAAPALADHPPGDGLTPKRSVMRFRDIVRPELIRFRSTRPGPLLVAGSRVAGAGTALLFADATARRYPDFDADELRSFDLTLTILRGRTLLEVTLGVLGALAVTSAYGSSTITPSLTAIPDRDRLLAAKALTPAGISLATGLAFQHQWVPGSPNAARPTPRASRRTPQPRLRPRCPWRRPPCHRRRAARPRDRHPRSLHRQGGLDHLRCRVVCARIGPAFPRPLARALHEILAHRGRRQHLRHPTRSQLRSPWRGLGVMAGSSPALPGSAFAVFLKREALTQVVQPPSVAVQKDGLVNLLLGHDRPSLARTGNVARDHRA